MLVLLPPSESKRGGGSGAPLDLDALAFPALDAARRSALAAVAELAALPDAGAAALRLGSGSAGEALHNRELATSPTMPAFERYDGVLYDAWDVPSLPARARAFAGRHVAIASALFGLTGALDPLPAYRLSHDSRVPGPSLRAIWRAALPDVLAAHDGLVLDLRSEGYRALGPAPAGERATFVRVVSEDAAGRRRALGHFNKAAKGALVRRLALAGVVPRDVAELLDWARAEGIRLDPGAPGELDLVA